MVTRHSYCHGSNSHGFDFEDACALNAKWNSLSVKKEKKMSNAATEEVISFFCFVWNNCIQVIIIFKFCYHF